MHTVRADDHTSRHCNSSNRKYANSKRNHDTYAKECQTRKRLLKERGTVENNKERNRATHRQRQYMEDKRKHQGITYGGADGLWGTAGFGGR